MSTALGAVTKRFVRQVVKAGAAAADMFAGSGEGVVFLIYHSVGGPRPGQVNVDPSVFDEQMAWLAERCAPVSIDEALVALRRSGQQDMGVSGPRVVVTFDDGTADFVDEALPILERYRIPVTIYLATGWLDDGRSFWDDGTVLSWSAMRDAMSTGLVTPGSHTHSHVLLDRTDPRKVADELDRSIASIAENLGIAPEHFAYPKALEPSTMAAEAVAARFRSAALAGSRANPYGATDPLRLARTPIQVADGLVWFRRKAVGGLRLEDVARSRLGALRYAKATR